MLRLVIGNNFYCDQNIRYFGYKIILVNKYVQGMYDFLNNYNVEFKVKLEKF